MGSSVCIRLRLQLVDATHALNLSAGVSNSNVSRGRSFNSRATLLSVACECTDKSVPFGKYCRNNRLVFSFEPRCQGLCGSQKYTSILVAKVKRWWSLLPTVYDTIRIQFQTKRAQSKRLSPCIEKFLLPSTGYFS